MAHTLLFTDLVDSTALIERIGDAQAAALWAEHDRIARRLLAEQGGLEIDRTDGFFLLFPGVPSALAFAAAYHAALAPLGLGARVGLHHAEVELRRNDAADVVRGAKPIEVEGLAKPLAARVMSLAGAGQTLLSAAAHAALGEALPAGLTLQSHGQYKLKGIEEPQVLFEAGAASSPFVPPPDTEKAWRVVQRDGLWMPLRAVPHNLAPERNAFVGRGAELRALAQRLEHGARLVTLTGVGGTGKTRLARRYGLAWLGEWPGGAYFCDLSEARSVEGICSAVAAALSVPLGRADPVLQLGHALAARGRCLLILDNFEQVVEHAAATLGRWLDRAAEMRSIVTSRELLHLAGEQLMALEPLPVLTEGVELFTVRARAQEPSFEFDAAVIELVELLDGLPLAIELAAARVRILSPAQMLGRLRDRFTLLAGAPGAAAARQTTLRAAIDWSWDLLAPWEQAALAGASVFEGGFDVDAAEAVLDLSAWSAAPPVIDVVQALVDKSLLRAQVPARRTAGAAAETLFGMYLSIHEYAAEKLARAGADAMQHLQRRHGGHYARLGTEQAVAALHGNGGAARRDRLMPQLDNLVAACARATARGDVGVALPCLRAAWQCLSARGPLSVAVAVATQVLGIGAIDAPSRAAALGVLAEAQRQTGNLVEANQAATEALRLATEAADPTAQARARSLLARILVDQGSPQEALAHQEIALAQHRRDGDRLLEGRALLVMGSASQLLGRVAQSREYGEAALAAARQTGDSTTEGSAHISLGLLANELSQYDAALASYEAGLAVLRANADRTRQATLLMNIANVHTDRGEVDAALAHYDQALVLAREVGHLGLEASLLVGGANVRIDQGRLVEAHAMLTKALALHREAGNHRSVAIALNNLSEVLRMLRRYDEAQRCGEESLQIARAAKLLRIEAYAMTGLATLQIDQRRSEGVGAMLDAARARMDEVADQTGALIVDCLGGELAALEGRFAAAARRLADVEHTARQLDMDSHPDVAETLERLRAVVAKSATPQR